MKSIDLIEVLDRSKKSKVEGWKSSMEFFQLHFVYRKHTKENVHFRNNDLYKYYGVDGATFTKWIELLVDDEDIANSISKRVKALSYEQFVQLTEQIGYCDKGVRFIVGSNFKIKNSERYIVPTNFDSEKEMFKMIYKGRESRRINQYKSYLESNIFEFHEYRKYTRGELMSITGVEYVDEFEDCNKGIYEPGLIAIPPRMSYDIIKRNRKLIEIDQSSAIFTLPEMTLLNPDTELKHRKRKSHVEANKFYPEILSKEELENFKEAINKEAKELIELYKRREGME